MNRVCREAWISGRVQGVGYRAFVRSAARQHGVSGWARNLHDGRVHVLLCGDAMAVAAVERCLHDGPRWSTVSTVDARDAQDPNLDEFTTG